nr:hypothetical protein [Anaerolineae bacterium]
MATAAVGLWEIVIVRGMLLRIYARFWSDYWSAVNVGNWAVFVLGAAWLALAVGGGEYHYKRVGQHGSWRLFGWTIAAEVAILILALFV